MTPKSALFAQQFAPGQDPALHSRVTSHRSHPPSSVLLFAPIATRGWSSGALRGSPRQLEDGPGAAAGDGEASVSSVRAVSSRLT